MRTFTNFRVDWSDQKSEVPSSRFQVPGTGKLLKMGIGKWRRGELSPKCYEISAEGFPYLLSPISYLLELNLQIPRYRLRFFR